MRDWEAQLRHGEKAYNYQNLTKNLPLKGVPRQPGTLHVVSRHAGMARMEGLVGIALLKVRDGDTPVREMGRDFQRAPQGFNTAP